MLYGLLITLLNNRILFNFLKQAGKTPFGQPIKNLFTFQPQINQLY
jgi:hypothetical protein